MYFNTCWQSYNASHFQQVTWPPPDHQAREKALVSNMKTLPNLSGTVHLGQARRKMLDAEFENVVKSSSSSYSSHPFTKGNFFNQTQLSSKILCSIFLLFGGHKPFCNPFIIGRYEPTKLNAEQIWSDSVNKHLYTVSGEELDIKPKRMLKDASEILTQTESIKSSSYRIPPGTSRTRKCQDTYVKGVQ